MIDQIPDLNSKKNKVDEGRRWFLTGAAALGLTAGSESLLRSADAQQQMPPVEPLRIDPNWLENPGTRAERVALLQRIAERVRSLAGDFRPPRSSSPEANEQAEEDLTKIFEMKEGSRALCFGTDDQNFDCAARFEFTSPNMPSERYSALVWPKVENGRIATFMLQLSRGGEYMGVTPNFLLFGQRSTTPAGDLDTATGSYTAQGHAERTLAFRADDRASHGDLETAVSLFRGIIEALAAGN